MPKVLIGANLGLRFLLELSALAATAYWGFETGSGAIGWLLAVGAGRGRPADSGGRVCGRRGDQRYAELHLGLAGTQPPPIRPPRTLG
jgi:hypothetical protein